MRDDAMRIAVRKRIEQHVVDHAVHRRAGTDAERERQDGEEGEARLATDASPRILEISNDGPHNVV